MSGEPVSQEQAYGWETADIIRMIMLMPSDPMIFNFSFYTEQTGTVKRLKRSYNLI